MNSNEAKTVADFLIADFEGEMAATLRVLGAVPDGHLDYSPDQKSKNALQLVRHIVLEDEWLLNCIANGEFTPPPDDSDVCGIMNPAGATAYYQEKIPAAIARVRACRRSLEQGPRHVRDDAGPGSELPGDYGEAFGPPSRAIEFLSARHGRQRAGHLRAVGRYGRIRRGIVGTAGGSRRRRAGAALRKGRPCANAATAVPAAFLESPNCSSFTPKRSIRER